MRQKPGKPKERIRTRSAGESFGELTLLKDMPWAATVRCLTPVDVVMFHRNDFLKLLRSHATTREWIMNELAGIK